MHAKPSCKIHFDILLPVPSRSIRQSWSCPDPYCSTNTKQHPWGHRRHAIFNEAKNGFSFFGAAFLFGIVHIHRVNTASASAACFTWTRTSHCRLLHVRHHHHVQRNVRRHDDGTFCRCCCCCCCCSALRSTPARFSFDIGSTIQQYTHADWPAAAYSSSSW